MFFLDGVHSQANDASQRIAKLQELRVQYLKLFSKDRSKTKLALLVDYLLSTPITSITQAQQSLNIGSFSTVQRLIEKLESLGIVREVTGKGRNRFYRADQILKILSESFA